MRDLLTTFVNALLGAQADAVCGACYSIRILEKYSHESGERFDNPLMNHPLDGELIESLNLRGDEVFEHVERLDQTAD